MRERRKNGDEERQALLKRVQVDPADYDAWRRLETALKRAGESPFRGEGFVMFLFNDVRRLTSAERKTRPHTSRSPFFLGTYKDFFVDLYHQTIRNKRHDPWLTVRAARTESEVSDMASRAWGEVGIGTDSRGWRVYKGRETGEAKPRESADWIYTGTDMLDYLGGLFPKDTKHNGDEDLRGKERRGRHDPREAFRAAVAAERLDSKATKLDRIVSFLVERVNKNFVGIRENSLAAAVDPVAPLEIRSVVELVRRVLVPGHGPNPDSRDSMLSWIIWESLDRTSDSYWTRSVIGKTRAVAANVLKAEAPKRFKDLIAIGVGTGETRSREPFLRDVWPVFSSNIVGSSRRDLVDWERWTLGAVDLASYGILDGEVLVFDNGGATADRYTVLISDDQEDGPYTHVYYMSRNCDQPNGINMYAGEETDINGLAEDVFSREGTREIKDFNELPMSVCRSIESERGPSRVLAECEIAERWVTLRDGGYFQERT